MLRAADALRLSAEVQHVFAQAEASNGVLEWMDLVEPLVERPLLAAFGVRDAESGLARLRYEPNVRPELRPLAHWLRHNRARPVPFAVGAAAPVDGVRVHCVPRSSEMVCADDDEVGLASCLPAGRPVLLVASSRT